MGNQRRGTGHGPLAPLRLGHRAERPHSSSHSESRRQYDFPYGAPDILSAAGTRSRIGTGSSHGAVGSASQDAGDHQRFRSEISSLAGTQRSHNRLSVGSAISGSIAKIVNRENY